MREDENTIVINHRNIFFKKAKKYFGEGKTNEIYYINTILIRHFGFSIEELSCEFLKFDGKGDAKIDHIVVSIDENSYDDLSEVVVALDKIKECDTKKISTEKCKILEVESTHKVKIFIFQLKDQNKKYFSSNEALLMRATIKDLLYANTELLEYLPYNKNIVLLSEILKRLCNSYYYLEMNVFYVVSKEEVDETKLNQTKNEILKIGKALEKEIINKNKISINFAALELDDLIENIDYLIENETKYSLHYDKKEKIELGAGIIITPTLKEYYDFLSCKNNNSFDKSLAEGNVRYYLGETKEVNAEIKSTLEAIAINENEINFFQKNNGATLIVDDYQCNDTTITLDAPKIVNGLQTSNSIFNVLSNIKNSTQYDKHRIILKIIKTKNAEEIKQITWGSNNQTGIKNSDMQSLEEIHLELKEEFWQKGYYYFIKSNLKNKDIPNEIYMTDISKAYFIFKENNTRIAKIKGDAILGDENYKKVFKMENKEELVEYAIFYKKMLTFLDKINMEIFEKQNNSLIKFIIILSITYLIVGDIDLKKIKELSTKINESQFRENFLNLSNFLIRYCKEKNIVGDISRKSKGKILNEDFYAWLKINTSNMKNIKEIK